MYTQARTTITTIDGKTSWDESAEKKEKFVLSWETLTKTEVDSILTIINKNTSVSFLVNDKLLVVNEKMVFPYVASIEYSITGSSYLAKLVLELIVETVGL